MSVAAMRSITSSVALLPADIRDEILDEGCLMGTPLEG